MAYMKRNVNFLLMLLVVIVLLSLVLLTTLYQQNYRNLTRSYQQTSEQLSEVSQNFSKKLSELNRTTAELTLKASDKNRLDQLYSDISAERDKLDTELETTKSILQETADKLINSQAELSDAKYELLKKGEEIAMLDSSVTNQKNKINKLTAENCDLNKQINPDYGC